MLKPKHPVLLRLPPRNTFHPSRRRSLAPKTRPVSCESPQPANNEREKESMSRSGFFLLSAIWKGELDKQERRSYPLLAHMHADTQSLLGCQGFWLINFQPHTNPKMRKRTIARASEREINRECRFSGDNGPTYGGDDGWGLFVVHGLFGISVWSNFPTQHTC